MYLFCFVCLSVFQFFLLLLFKHLEMVNITIVSHPFELRNVLFNDTLNTFYFTVIWRRTYGKGPLRE